MNLLLPLFLSLGLLSTIAKADTLAETLGRTSGLAQTTASREAVPPARSGFMPEPGRVLQDLYPDGRPAAREAGRQMWELLLLRGALSSGASDAVAAPDVDEFRRTLGTANLLLYTEDDLQALQGQQAALISLLKEAADRRAHGPAAARAALLLGAMASRLRPETSALQVDLAEETLEAARRRLGAGPWTAAQQEVFDTQVELARRRAALPPDLGPAAQLALARGPFAAGRAYWEQVGEEHGALPKGGVTHLVVDGSPEETRTRLEAWRKESPSKELDRLLAGWGKSVVLHRSGELPAGTIDEGGLFHARIFLRRAAPGLESSPIQVTSGGSRVDLAGLVAQITFWLTEELPLTLTSKEWESAAEAERILAVAA